jgi:predicted dithiol-disulfide oxidoreductase (DUF899 family)
MSADHPNRPARIAPRKEWLAARIALLEKEKALTAMKDALAAERRALPWVRVEKNYVFTGPTGPVTLSELFAGRSQLFVKHFMMGPGQSQQCVGCALEVDHLAGIRVHLEHHDVAYAVVARAPIDEIERLKRKVTPKGRAENGSHHSLPDWVRPHNMYGRGGTVTGMGQFHAANCGCAAHP